MLVPSGGLGRVFSEEFRTRWARHDVEYHRAGRKRIHHPIVGDLAVRALVRDQTLPRAIFPKETVGPASVGLGHTVPCPFR